MNRLMKWPLLCGLLALALSRAALSADALYQNDAIVSYPGTTTFPPVIDATNFVNNGSFTINFTTLLSLVQPFYETSDTLNYTNNDNGVMMVNSGFRFDNQSTSTGFRTTSANFFNSGLVSCSSVNNLADPFGGLLGRILGFGQCIINATNIVNPGTLNVGLNGMILASGNNLDFSHGALNVEGGGANAFGSGVFDLNTNAWNPGGSLGQNGLGQTIAISAFIPVFQPLFFRNFFGTMWLTNATAYVNQTQGPTNMIISAVFIEDNSLPNVPVNVYFDTRFLQFGFGTVTIEWLGSYLDPATGNVFKNYLYMTDDYDLGASTNVLLNGNGFPDNFSFAQSPTQLVPYPGVTATPAGLPIAFPFDAVTNRYAFANVQLTSTSVSTNTIVNGALTNLPGRILIFATNELNLAFTQITGPNFMTVRSTNQFDGSAGAMIQSPYSDINVGVTNGFLNLTNLIAPQVPNWGGNVQAWTANWTGIDANGVTNDYRVLIVGSVLQPTTKAQVQDLILHGKNLVISDTYNIMRTFTADAQNLTLTTNGFGNGATSLDGEINSLSPFIYLQTSLPNLRNLTNSGAIRMLNLINFGAQVLTNVSASVPAAAATGLLSAAGTNVVKNDNVTLGANQYTFVSTLTNAVANQVKIVPTSFDGSLSNLIAAINGAAGSGTSYSSATKSNAAASAGPLTSHAIPVTARIAGAAGNTIATTFKPATTSTNLTWNGHNTLIGGANLIPVTTNVVSFLFNTSFINNGLISDQGSIIYAGNFVNTGVISNGINSFALQSLTSTMTNGFIVAGGDMSITASSLVTSNLSLQAGRSLTLQVTNLLTDGVPNGTSGLTNGNVWQVQSTNGSGGNGLILPIKPLAGDLLGTTISNTAAGPNKLVSNLWAGRDRGVSANGFTNNVAVGRLVLDAVGPNSQFKFSGAGTSNAIYVDELVFLDQATNGIFFDEHGSRQAFDFSPWLNINTNMFVYFAQAVVDGVSIAEKIDAASKAGRNNGGRLRWVPAYAGYFSATNIVYPDGTTNTLNAALAGASLIDSDGDGIPNATDPTPVFVGSELHFNLTLTNSVPKKLALVWNSIPSSTNFVFFKTNLLSANWRTLTNFVSPAAVPPVGGWPITNVIYDQVTNQARFYQIRLDPAN